MKAIALTVLLAAIAYGQQRARPTVNVESDEGKLLQEIEQQKDEAKKQALLEQFAAKYPQHQGTPWVYEQLQVIFLKHNQFDRTLDAGVKALTLDHDDLEAAYHNLKAAEGKKAPEPIKKWALETSRIARAGASTPDAKQAEYSRQVGIYCEYALYVTALQSTDPATAMDLVETLEKLNPKSEYLPKVYGAYLNAMRQSGQAEKAGAAAEKIAEKDNASPDVFLIAADYNLQKKTEPDKVILYCTRLLEALKNSPEDEHKSSLTGLANWMLGVTYSSQAKHGQADKTLRAALPLLKDEQVRASALFYLGLTDYQFGKATRNKALIQDALFFSEQSAAIASPLQAQAQKNVRSIKGELGIR